MHLFAAHEEENLSRRIFHVCGKYAPKKIIREIFTRGEILISSLEESATTTFFLWHSQMRAELVISTNI